jgi:type II secretory pathway component PulM
MKNWFMAQTTRDQLALLALALAVGLWLLFTLVLAPVSQSRSAMESNNRNASELLNRVDAKVTELIALRGSQQGGASGNLSAQISRSAEATGLTISRLQPNSRGEVQVRFEGVDFDRLLSWLAAVEGDLQLLVIDASISQAGQSGGVNATLRLAGGG